MSGHALRLIAGKTARRRIEENGLTPDLVRLVLGASGGPKWLVLKGLDQYVLGEWLPKAAQPIDLIGSSIGAFRMSVAAHPEPAKMVQRLEDTYLSYRADKGLTAEAVTKQSYDIVNALFPPEDAVRVVANADRRPLNIVAVRGKGPAASHHALIEGLGVLLAAGANLMSRKALGLFYERVVFHTGHAVPSSHRWQGFGRIDIPLRPEALVDAIMASGSIPYVIDPITEIAGAPRGNYRDGGVTDYHFDVMWDAGDGIVLYPHFYPYLVPGWFDKKLKGRRVRGEALDNLLILAPSDEFVASLPHGRIPERKDFGARPDADRLKDWRKVVAESGRLGEEFAMLSASPGKLMERLEMAPQ
ncbi:hypothetical protein [Pseudokordiimonas caeni]|uniref:hypothetical protein n=1 Tax=Pseudokordiimonas caeni TaxID=2997908 RepID=UPI002810F0A1|nr:hypothetical protein [Pseudokordiimonas caeni]